MDIDFGNLLGIASKVSEAINNAESLFSGVKNLLKNRKIPAGTAGNLLELSSELSDAKLGLARLEIEIAKLQRDWEALDEFKQRKRNYVFVEMVGGGFVYQLRPDAGTGEPMHEVCPNCLEQKRIMPLQPRGDFLHCDSCGAKIRAKRARPLPTRAELPPYDET